MIGEGTTIGPYCIIGPNVVIGANCRLIARPCHCAGIGTWRSSLTRKDSGNGACELVWVEELRPLR